MLAVAAELLDRLAGMHGYGCALLDCGARRRCRSADEPRSIMAVRFVGRSLQLHWGLGTWEGRLWLCVTRSIHSVCMIQSIQIQFSHDQLLAPSPHRFLRSPGFDEHVDINCFCVCLLRRYALNLLCQKRRTLFTGPVPGSGSTHTR